MFCPKCGTQNIEDVRFCRNCGTVLSGVSDALSGKLPTGQTPQPNIYVDRKGKVRSNDPNEIWSHAIRNIITGIGFLVVAMALLTTGVAGGRAWWWAMLFPAFGSLANGISQMAKVKRMEKQFPPNQSFSTEAQNQFPNSRTNANLPPQQTSFIENFAETERYKTEDLVAPPPSVTENTTRHLKFNQDGETMPLPKTKEN